jgi:hypothetical protein
MFPTLSSILTVLTSALSVDFFPRFDIPELLKDEWLELDANLKKELAPFNHYLSKVTNDLDIAILGDQIGYTISNFLEANPAIFEKKTKGGNSAYIKNDSKTLTELRSIKKELRRQLQSKNPPPSLSKSASLNKEIWSCIKAISDVKRLEKKKSKEKSVLHQEGLFRKNKFDFSKQCINGTLGCDSAKPTFSKETADRHYTGTYDIPIVTDIGKLSWFHPVSSIGPGESDFIDFENTVIKPREVREILKKANHKSSPGPDGVTYGVLHHLPCTHLVLATLFSHVLRSGVPPKSWSASFIKLIHKAGSKDDPSNFRPIALSNCVGKTFHLILSKRTTKFVLDNKLVDVATQKAFLPGISGCTEHTMTLSEIIRQTKLLKRTLHVTFFDLADAFGSVPHGTIHHALSRNHFPANIKNYFKLYYSNLESCVVTDCYKTETFKFRKGVTQGDPMSPILFLLAFQPILDHLNSKASQGANLGDIKVITLPFADDFCLMTTNKRTHQNLISDIKEKVESMGLKLKPSKCRSFSLSAGSPKVVDFYIGNYCVPSVAVEEQKFLGKVMFFSCSEADTLKYILGIINERLTRLNLASVRNEYKLWVYKFYFLPSLRFLLTIHELNKTSLSVLDATCNKFLKNWGGLPRCATMQVIHNSSALGISSLSDLYLLCHALELTNVRLNADVTVNKALDLAVNREENNAKSVLKVTSKSQSVFTEAQSSVTLSVPLPTLPSSLPTQSKSKTTERIKAKVKQILQKEVETRDQVILENLSYQGGFLLTLAKAKTCPMWQSQLSSLRKGCIKFLLNASINCLPTQNNLKLWGLSKTDKCFLCSNRDSTLHLLAGCPVSLRQQRYTWRHDSVLNYVRNLFNDSGFIVTCDLPGGSKYGERTTLNPAHVSTPLFPDLVIESENELTIIELTVPFETNVESRHKFKEEKYSHFTTDITYKKCKLICFEIGARGHISEENKSRIKSILKLSKKSISAKSVLQTISNIVFAASYTIFCQRKNVTWDENMPLLTQ